MLTIIFLILGALAFIGAGAIIAQSVSNVGPGWTVGKVIMAVVLLFADFEAQTRVKQAEGERDARVTRAQGEADANQLISESLTESLLQWTYIQKLSDKVRLMMLPTDQDFMIDLSTVTEDALAE